MFSASPAVSRLRIHQRRVSFEGFKRSDGLWEIEASLCDTKDQDCPLPSGLRKPGEPIHDMWLRVTIDPQMNILAVEAKTKAAPFLGTCETILPDYAQIVGLNLFDGFLKQVKARFGGAQGCTHISELLMSLPTAALQSMSGENLDRELTQKPYHLDRCHAMVSHSPMVRRYYPRWHQRSEEQAERAELAEKA